MRVSAKPLSPDVTTYTPTEVRDKLREHGVSITAFARMVGIAEPPMYRILSGKANPARMTRIRIAEVIDVLDHEGPPPTPLGLVVRLRRL